MIQYRLHPIHNNIAPDEEEGYYPVIVRAKTLTTREIAKFIQQRNSFTEADVLGVLDALSDAIASYLALGRNIHWDALGTFSLKIRFKQNGKESSGITGKQIEVQNVKFRTSPDLLERLGSIHFSKEKKK